MIADTQDNGTPTFTDLLRSEVARLQAAQPERLGEFARAHALIIDGWVVANDDGTGKVLASNLCTWYTVNGACTCEAAQHGKSCKHLQAWKLYKHVAKKYAEQVPPPPVPPHDEPEESLPVTIPRRYIQRLHGKNHIVYMGLLALAHEAGLCGLSEDFVGIPTAEFALATATATFRDGRVFHGSADASKANVTQQMQPHVPRMALTRAKARALRDALNIGICAVEELG